MAKHTSFFGSFGRQRSSRKAPTKNERRNRRDRRWLQPPSFLLSYFEYTVFFNTIVQCYKLTRQYNYSMFFLLHTLYKSVWVASPQHAANTSGGEFRSRSLQVFTALLGVTRSRDGSILLSDQSLLSTSSQISSIKRRKAVSIMSRAICESSTSVGMRPAPKTES
jgi:hypothetical protein